MDDDGQLVNGVQNAIDPQPHDALFALGLEVDIGRALAKGVVEKVIDGVDDVAVRGVDVFELPNRHELFKVANRNLRLIYRRRLLGRCRRHARLEAINLGNRPQNSRFRSQHRGNVVALHLAQRPDEFVVVRQLNGHGQNVLAQRNGQDDVHLGKVLAKRLCDELLVEPQRVDAQIRHTRSMRPNLDDFLLLERTPIGRHRPRRHDDFDGRRLVARLRHLILLNQRSNHALPHANHLRLLKRNHVFAR